MPIRIQSELFGNIVRIIHKYMQPMYNPKLPHNLESNSVVSVGDDSWYSFKIFCSLMKLAI